MEHLWSSSSTEIPTSFATSSSVGGGSRLGGEAGIKPFFQDNGIVALEGDLGVMLLSVKTYVHYCAR